VQEAFILCTAAQSDEAILAPKALSPKHLAACKDLGLHMGAGLAMGIY
jgi:hypothetical protein